MHDGLLAVVSAAEAEGMVKASIRPSNASIEPSVTSPRTAFSEFASTWNLRSPIQNPDSSAARKHITSMNANSQIGISGRKNMFTFY
jgi:hypothetical protein